MAKAKGWLITPEKVKEEETVNQRVEVDGVASEMRCKITFYREKGNIVIASQITTKQLSFDENMQDIVLKLNALQMKSAYVKALELKREFLESKSNYDPDQGELPFGGDEGEFVTFGLPGNAQED